MVDIVQAKGSSWLLAAQDGTGWQGENKSALLGCLHIEESSSEPPKKETGFAIRIPQWAGSHQ